MDHVGSSGGHVRAPVKIVAAAAAEPVGEATPADRATKSEKERGSERGQSAPPTPEFIVRNRFALPERWMEPITTQDAAVESASSRQQRWQPDLQWPAVLWIALLHIGALAAPFCFTWYGLWIALALSWMTGGLEVCLGYHRLLTHNTFETYRPIRGLLALLGTLAGEGPPIMWASVHRQYHRFSDVGLSQLRNTG